MSTAWWAELLEACPAVHDWTLTFVGPEVKPARPTPIQRGTKSLAVKAERRELTKADLDEARTRSCCSTPASAIQTWRRAGCRRWRRSKRRAARSS